MNKIKNSIKKIRTYFLSDLTKSCENYYSLRERHTKYTFGDQKGQVDYLVNNVLNYEVNGLLRDDYFFIDLACADGVTINNTFFLEKHLNWNGLLFEPNPMYKNQIRDNRSSVHINKCVTDKIGDVVNFRMDNGMLGGIVESDFDNNEKNRGKELLKAEIVSLETTTLEFELESNNAPSIIDFMSLDVEGAEYLVLKAFPFDKYKFRCIAIERPSPDLDLLLDSKNYIQVKHLKHDVIYVHRNFLSDVNFDPNVHFMFTPKKDW